MKSDTDGLLQHLPEFLDALRVERRLAENTVRSYGRDLALFGLFLREQGSVSPLSAGHRDLQEYLGWLAARRLSARSRRLSR